MLSVFFLIRKTTNNNAATKNLLQVRLELTASASYTVYKYSALTDCATGAAYKLETC